MLFLLSEELSISPMKHLDISPSRPRIGQFLLVMCFTGVAITAVFESEVTDIFKNSSKFCFLKQNKKQKDSPISCILCPVKFHKHTMLDELGVFSLHHTTCIDCQNFIDFYWCLGKYCNNQRERKKLISAQGGSVER